MRSFIDKNRSCDVPIPGNDIATLEQSTLKRNRRFGILVFWPYCHLHRAAREMSDKQHKDFSISRCQGSCKG